MKTSYSSTSYSQVDFYECYQYAELSCHDCSLIPLLSHFSSQLCQYIVIHSKCVSEWREKIYWESVCTGNKIFKMVEMQQTSAVVGGGQGADGGEQLVLHILSHVLVDAYLTNLKRHVVQSRLVRLGAIKVELETPPELKVASDRLLGANVRYEDMLASSLSVNNNLPAALTRHILGELTSGIEECHLEFSGDWHDYTLVDRLEHRRRPRVGSEFLEEALGPLGGVRRGSAMTGSFDHASVLGCLQAASKLNDKPRERAVPAEAAARLWRRQQHVGVVVVQDDAMGKSRQVRINRKRVNGASHDALHFAAKVGILVGTAARARR